MVTQVLNLITQVFFSCAKWTSDLLDAVEGKGIILAAFSVVLAIGLLFLPMRGRMSATSFVSDYKSYKAKAEKSNSGKG